jgi:hypothetical protein
VGIALLAGHANSNTTEITEIPALPLIADGFADNTGVVTVTGAKGTYIFLHIYYKYERIFIYTDIFIHKYTYACIIISIYVYSCIYKYPYADNTGVVMVTGAKGIICL